MKYGKVLMGARDNNLQKLRISQNEILLTTILPTIFSIAEKFEIYFLGLP